MSNWSTRKRSVEQARETMFEPALCIDESDLMVSLKAMYHVIQDDILAFAKYQSQLDFLADLKSKTSQEMLIYVAKK